MCCVQSVAAVFAMGTHCLSHPEGTAVKTVGQTIVSVTVMVGWISVHSVAAVCAMTRQRGGQYVGACVYNVMQSGIACACGATACACGYCWCTVQKIVWDGCTFVQNMAAEYVTTWH